MTALLRYLSTAVLACGSLLSAAGQSSAPAPVDLRQLIPPMPPIVPESSANPEASAVLSPVRQLLDFPASKVKFSLADLMDLLRDRRHEGWVLGAYPDPKTGRPLIGAGFSLDLPEREHPQPDPLNPHQFVEPSSAQLWQAAGLNPDRLRQILDRYDENLAVWKKRRFRRRIPALPPEITDQEATSLLRVSAIQAIENARAYCRNFDDLTGPQQMALSQLVYQMGINLEQFGHFLDLINNDGGPGTAIASNGEHWKTVQYSLIRSQWARLYRARAVSVIAMLDPRYEDEPTVAEHRVAAILHPPVRHRHRRHRAVLRTASWHRHSVRPHRRSSRSRARGTAGRRV